jgi:hypothetical protein
VSLAIIAAICAYRGARAPRAWGWALVLSLALTVMFGLLALAEPARARSRVTILLEEVNRHENAAHEPGSPLPTDHSGGELDGKWHCVNYAFAKAARLAAAGIPARAMHVVPVVDEQGESHAVLLVATSDAGEWILDNRFAAPQRKADLVRKGYRFTSGPDLIDPTLPMRAWWLEVFRRASERAGSGQGRG